MQAHHHSSSDAPPSFPVPSFEHESTALLEKLAPPPYEEVAEASTTAPPEALQASDYPTSTSWAGHAHHSMPNPALHIVPPAESDRASTIRSSYIPSTPSTSSAASPITPTSTSSIFNIPPWTEDASSSSSNSIARRGSASTTTTSTHAHARSHSHSHSPSSPHAPHPSFDRRPPPHAAHTYPPFPPASHYAHSDDLTRGFPLAPPACAGAPPAPHPFATHDVNEADWAAFLADVRDAGGLRPVHALLADAAPAAVRTGIIGGYLAGKALKAHVKGKRKSPVADIVELWNRRFFHPRCMDVVLAQGMIAYTGPVDTLPADRVRPRAAPRKKDKHVKMIEDHSDDEESRSSRLDGIADAVDTVGEHLGKRGTFRRGRLEFGLDLKNSARERWRVVITYKPPVL